MFWIDIGSMNDCSDFRGLNMMKMNQIVALGLIIMVLFLLSSCGGGPASPSSPGNLNPPADVNVVRDAGGLLVRWSGVAGAESYKLLRKDGAGDFLPVPDPNTLVQGTSWQDMDYPRDRVLQYKVISCGACKTPSPPSAPSNPVSEQVLDTEASIMSYPDQIALKWSIHPENPTFYRIRRSTTKGDGNGLIIAETTTNSFNDISSSPNNPPAVDTPYYYRVTWVKSGKEYGLSVQDVCGLYSGAVDTFEPNGEMAKAAILVRGLNYTTNTFAFNQPMGECLTDPDWYLYQRNNNNPETVTVIITLPAGSPFQGKLKMQAFDGNGHLRGGQVLYNVANLCIYNLQPGDTALYLKIEPIGVSGNEGIGTYRLEVE